jgi:hypothetical protein
MHYVSGPKENLLFFQIGALLFSLAPKINSEKLFVYSLKKFIFYAEHLRRQKFPHHCVFTFFETLKKFFCL